MDKELLRRLIEETPAECICGANAGIVREWNCPRCGQVQGGVWLEYDAETNTLRECSDVPCEDIIRRVKY